MLDDADDLAADSTLRELLTYYVSAGDDREAWHGRVTEWPGLSDADLTRRHGRLIAAAYVEMAVGVTPTVYRATAGGRRVLRGG